jgi:hypothetical protein
MMQMVLPRFDAARSTPVFMYFFFVTIELAALGEPSVTGQFISTQ